MTHKIKDRTLCGSSHELNGCVLDDPHPDPNDPILHRVYCADTQRVYMLTRRIYEERIKEIDQKRPNDCFKIEDARLYFGKYIKFTIGERNSIVDFVLGTDKEDALFEDGRNVFKSKCVFNKDHTECKTEHFNVISLNPEDILALNLLPTPNVVVICYIEFAFDGDPSNLVPKIYKVAEIDATNQEFATTSFQSKPSTANYDYDDGDVHLESNELEDNGMTVRMKGFITGLTSVFIPAMPSETVLLPTYSRKTHSIGRETQCDLVFNESLQCHVVFSLKPSNCSHFNTLLQRKSDDVEGLFYIQLCMEEHIHGFYKHPLFKLIADPYGFLDLAKFACKAKNIDESKRICNFIVPIKDRLGKKHESRKLFELDKITRFEVVSSGDDANQIDLIEGLRKQEANIDGGGVVINAQTGLVYGHKYHGVIFKLPSGHKHRAGDCIKFKAVRTVDLDVSQPIFLITGSSIKENVNGPRFNVEKDGPGRFYFKARYNKSFKCYESELFGYIPCEKPHPEQPIKKTKAGEPIEKLYEISAIENTHLPGQTVLCKGRFIRAVD